MRPGPIPAEAVWDGAVRRVFAAPDGDLTNPDIAPVEAVVDRSPSTGALAVSVRLQLEPGDLEALAGGGHVWLTMLGGLMPFSAAPSAVRSTTRSAPSAARRPPQPTACTACGAVEVDLNQATGTRDLSDIGESDTYPTGYGCEVCS